MDAGLIREEEVVQPIRDGIIEKSGNPKEPFRDQVNSLDEHLKLQVIPEINGGKIGNGKDEHDYIANAGIMAHPDVFKIIALLDIPEGFFTFPPGQIDLHNPPYGFFDLHVY